MRLLIREKFDALWKTQISAFSKSALFRLFKERIKSWNYLDIKNRKLKVSFITFGLSDHCLMIEKGRHKRPTIPREQCFCPKCPTRVDNEVHLLTQCSAYANRNDLFAAIEKEVPNFVNLNVHAQFIYMMSQENGILNYRIMSTVHE